MSDETQAHLSRDERLEQVLAEYLRQVEQAGDVDQQALLQANPDLADDLREFFGNQVRMQRLAAPLMASVPPHNQSTFFRADAAQVGLCIGSYTLVQKLGEGGMGEVWVAKQSEPVKRKVALKLIRHGSHSKEVLTRFEHERQALAMMDHPNIAKVFDGGATPSGQPYFVMELVNGLPLTKYCDEARLTLRERMQLFVPICQAVQHAHQKGIVHRDLKPSNILVTIYDGQPVPKVIDFGVAKATGGKLTDDTMSTQFGAVVGTLEYMSPEQTGFHGQDVDTRADIYSLGVILYELLTGLRPMDGQRLRNVALAEMIRVIQEDEPSKPSTRLSSDAALPSLAALRQIEPKRLTALLRGELDWVVMKCLEKSRDRRYETANGLARDIEHYLADEPVEARPPSAGYRLSKFLRRNKGPVMAASLVLLALIAGIIGTSWGLVREGQQRQIAETNEGKAKEATKQERIAKEEERIAKEKAIVIAIEERKQRDRADENFRQMKRKSQLLQKALYFSDMKLVQSAWESGQFETMGNLLSQHRPHSGEDDLRGFEWWYWNRKCHDQRTLTGHGGIVGSVAFSLDGRRLFSVSDTVNIWDVASGKLASSHTISLSNVVAFNRDGTRLATSVHGSTVVLWDTYTGLKTQIIQGQSGISSLAFSPNGSRIATGNDDATVKLWDTDTGQEILTLRGHTKKVGGLAFSLDGLRIATASDDATVKVWDTATGHECATLSNQDNYCFAFSPNGKQIATGCQDNSMKLWEVDTGKELLSFSGHTDVIWAIAFSPDGTRIASASEDKTVKVWNTGTGRENFTLKGHTDVVSCVAFSSDGLRIVTGSDDKTVKHWDAVTGDETLTIKANTGHLTVSWPMEHVISDPMKHVLCMAFSPDGTRLVSGSYDRTCRIWDAATGLPIHALEGHTGCVFSVAYSRDGKWIASADTDGTVKLWNAHTGKERLTFKGHKGYVRSVAFSPNGTRIASAGGQMIKVWNADSGEELRTIDWQTGVNRRGISSVAFSPDGSRIVSGSFEDYEVKVWDVVTGQALRTLAGHTGPVLSVTFSPDGMRIATASADRTVKLWNANTSDELLTFKGHEHLVPSVVFTTDGKRIVAGSGDKHHLNMGDLIEGDHPGELMFWDAETGQETLTLKGHTGPIISLAISADGKRIASSSFDGMIKLWDAP